MLVVYAFYFERRPACVWFLFTVGSRWSVDIYCKIMAFNYVVPIYTSRNA